MIVLYDKIGKKPTMKLNFLHREREAGDAVSFSFRAPKPFSWQPGQYMVYLLEHEHPDNRGIKRYFTIATAPFEKDIRIATRISDEKRSSFKDTLVRMQEGQTIEAEGPKGSFVMEDPKQHSVFIAGGIGVTPFRSMLLDLEHRNLPIHVTLLYANKTSEFVYKKEFERLVTTFPNFQVHYIVEPEHITKDTIKKLAPNLKESIFYVSGPVSMVEATTKILSMLNVPSDHVKEDYFPGYD